MQPHRLGEVFIEACEEIGIFRNDDYNGAQQIGASLLQFTIKNNQRHSTAAAFLKPAMKRKNLTVRTQCQVKSILIGIGMEESVVFTDPINEGISHLGRGKEINNAFWKKKIRIKKNVRSLDKSIV